MTTLFFDENLAHRLVRAIRLLQPKSDPHKVWHLVDVFPKGVPDEHWIPIVGEKRWVAVTGDEKIYKTDYLLDLLTLHRVRTYFVRGSLRSRHDWDTCLRWLALWPRLVAHASEGADEGRWLVPEHGWKFVPYAPTTRVPRVGRSPRVPSAPAPAPASAQARLPFEGPDGGGGAS